MTNMVDWVARALWDDHQSSSYIQFASNDLMFGKEWGGKRVPWEYLLTDKIVQSAAEEWRKKARIAIAAMREPTLEMLCEGQSEIYIERNENPAGPHTYASREELTDAWQVMIDAALKT